MPQSGDRGDTLFSAGKSAVEALGNGIKVVTSAFLCLSLPPCLSLAVLSRVPFCKPQKRDLATVCNRGISKARGGMSCLSNHHNNISGPTRSVLSYWLTCWPVSLHLRRSPGNLHSRLRSAARVSCWPLIADQSDRVHAGSWVDGKRASVTNKQANKKERKRKQKLKRRRRLLASRTFPWALSIITCKCVTGHR